MSVIPQNPYLKTEQAKTQLAQSTRLSVVTIYPDRLPDKAKTDFNDILVHSGKKSLSDMITRGLKAEKEIDAGLIEKYRHAIDAGLSLDDVSKLAKSIGQAQNSLKLDSQKHHEFASIINKSNDVNKIIDGVRALEKNHSATEKQPNVSHVKALGNIELEI